MLKIAINDTIRQTCGQSKPGLHYRTSYRVWYFCVYSTAVPFKSTDTMMLVQMLLDKLTLMSELNSLDRFTNFLDITNHVKP